MGYLFTKDSLAKWRPVIPFCVIGMMMASVVNMFAGTSLAEFSRIYDRKYDVWLLERKMKIEVQKETMLAIIRAGNRMVFPIQKEVEPCK